MDIEEHVRLQQALIAALNSRIGTATSLGDIARLADLEAELVIAEETLARLQAA